MHWPHPWGSRLRFGCSTSAPSMPHHSVFPGANSIADSGPAGRRLRPCRRSTPPVYPACLERTRSKIPTSSETAPRPPIFSSLGGRSDPSRLPRLLSGTGSGRVGKVHPLANKPFIIILDLLYQYAIIVLLSRHDSSVPCEPCPPTTRFF